MKKLVDFYNKAEEYLLVATLVITVALIFYQVVMRYAFNNSPTWTEEISRYIFVWQVWLGISIGQKVDRHIRVTLLNDALIKKGKLKTKNTIEIVILLVWLAFTAVITVGGFGLVAELAARNALSAGLRFPMAIAYSAVPIGCLMASIRIVYSIYLESRKLLKGGVA